MDNMKDKSAVFEAALTLSQGTIIQDIVNELKKASKVLDNYDLTASIKIDSPQFAELEKQLDSYQQKIRELESIKPTGNIQKQLLDIDKLIEHLNRRGARDDSAVKDLYNNIIAFGRGGGDLQAPLKVNLVYDGKTYTNIEDVFKFITGRIGIKTDNPFKDVLAAKEDGSYSKLLQVKDIQAVQPQIDEIQNSINELMQSRRQMIEEWTASNPNVETGIPGVNTAEMQEFISQTKETIASTKQLEKALKELNKLNGNGSLGEENNIINPATQQKIDELESKIEHIYSLIESETYALNGRMDSLFNKILSSTDDSSNKIIELMVKIESAQEKISALNDSIANKASNERVNSLESNVEYNSARIDGSATYSELRVLEDKLIDSNKTIDELENKINDEIGELNKDSVSLSSEAINTIVESLNKLSNVFSGDEFENYKNLFKELASAIGQVRDALVGVGDATSETGLPALMNTISENLSAMRDKLNGMNFNVNIGTNNQVARNTQYGIEATNIINTAKESSQSLIKDLNDAFKATNKKQLEDVSDLIVEVWDKLTKSGIKTKTDITDDSTFNNLLGSGKTKSGMMSAWQNFLVDLKNYFKVIDIKDNNGKALSVDDYYGDINKRINNNVDLLTGKQDANSLSSLFSDSVFTVKELNASIEPIISALNEILQTIRALPIQANDEIITVITNIESLQNTLTQNTSAIVDKLSSSKQDSTELNADIQNLIQSINNILNSTIEVLNKLSASIVNELSNVLDKYTQSIIEQNPSNDNDLNKNIIDSCNNISTILKDIHQQLITGVATVSNKTEKYSDDNFFAIGSNVKDAALFGDYIKEYKRIATEAITMRDKQKASPEQYTKMMKLANSQKTRATRLANTLLKDGTIDDASHDILKEAINRAVKSIKVKIEESDIKAQSSLKAETKNPDIVQTRKDEANQKLKERNLLLKQERDLRIELAKNGQEDIRANDINSEIAAKQEAIRKNYEEIQQFKDIIDLQKISNNERLTEQKTIEDVQKAERQYDRKQAAKANKQAERDSNNIDRELAREAENAAKQEEAERLKSLNLLLQEKYQLEKSIRNIEVEAINTKSDSSNIETMNKESEDLKERLAQVDKLISSIATLSEKEEKATKEGIAAEKQQARIAKAERDRVKAREELGQVLTDKTYSSIREVSQDATRILGINDSDVLATKLEQSQNSLVVKFKNANNEIEKMRVSLDDLGNVRGMSVAITQVDTLDGILKRIGKRLLAVVGYKFSAYQIFAAIKNGINTIIQLDSAMVEVKKVSDETSRSYENFRQTMAQIAKEVATTNQELINSAASFMRLGYSIKDATELAKAATVFVNVGDGVDIEAATNDIIVAMKAFDIESKNVMSIIDAYNQVGNTFAISASGIGDAMQRSASSLEAANNTFEESVALVTAMNELIQDSDAVGTTLKVLSLRLRGASVDLEEMGESTEDLCTSTSKLQEKLLALTGVDIMSSATEFKSTAQIIKEIGAVWDNLSDINQSAALELMAGKTRANNVKALLKNYKQIDNVLAAIADDEGSAMTENEAVIDSVAGKIEQLKAGVEEFWQQLISSDFLKDVVDTARQLLDIVNGIGKATTKLRSGGSLVTTLLGSAISLKTKKNYFDAFAESKETNNVKRAFSALLLNANEKIDTSAINEYNTLIDSLAESQTKIGDSGEAFDKYNKILSSTNGVTRQLIVANKEQKVSTEEITKATKAAITTEKVWASVKNIAKGIGTGLIIGAITFGIEKLIQGIQTFVHRVDNAKEALIDASKEIKENFETLKKKIDDVNNSAERFAKLSQELGSNATQGTLSNNEYSEFLELSNKFAEIFPELTDRYDENGNAVISLNGDFQTIVDTLKQLIEQEKRLANIEIADTFNDQWKNAQTVIKSYTKEMEDIQAASSLVSSISDDSFSAYFATTDEYMIAMEKFEKLMNSAVENGKYKNQNFFPTESIDDNIPLELFDNGMRGTSWNFYGEAGKEFLTEFHDEIVDIFNISQHTVENIVNQYTSKINKELQPTYTSIERIIDAWLYTNDSFTFSDKQLAMITSFVNTLDWSKYISMSGEEIKQMINDGLLDVLVNNKEASDLFSKLLTVDSSSREAVNIVESIQKILNNGQYDIDITPYIADTRTIYDAIDTAIQKDIKHRNYYSPNLYDKFTALSATEAETFLHFYDDTTTLEEAWQAYLDSLKGSKSTFKLLDKDFELFEKWQSNNESLAESYHQAMLEIKDETDATVLELMDKFKDLGDYDWSDVILGKKTTGAFLKEIGQQELDKIKDNFKNETNAKEIQDMLQTMFDREWDFGVKVNYEVENYQEVSGILEKIQSGQSFDVTEMSSIITKYSELSSAVIDLGDSYSFAEDEVNSLIASLAGEANTDISKYIQELTQQLDTSYGHIFDFGDYDDSGRWQSVTKDVIEEYKKRITFLKATSLSPNEQLWDDINTELEKLIGLFDLYDDSLDKSKTQTEEVFDWIERRLAKLQNDLSDLQEISNDVFSSFGLRRGTIDDQEAKIKELITNTKLGIERYKKELDKIGLPQYYQDAIMSGQIDIEKISDSSLADTIKEWQSWWEKIENCQDSLRDLVGQYNELVNQRVDLIVTQFDSIVGIIDDAISTVDAKMSYAQAFGIHTSKKYYDEMSKQEKVRLAALAQEEADIRAEIEKTSYSQNEEEWYTLQSKLNDVSQQIIESQTKIKEYSNTVRQSIWDDFETLINKIKSITNETGLLNGLLESEQLFDEYGNYTSAGQSSLAMSSINFDVYSQNLEQYKKALADVNKELKNDKYNEALIEQQEAYQNAIVETVNAINNERKAIIDLEKSAIEQQIAAMQKLIDKKKEQINIEQELYSWQKTVSEQSQEIASLEKQLAVANADNSEEGRQRLQTLKSQLKTAQQNLKDSQLEKQNQVTQNTLDELMQEYSDLQDKRMQDLNGLVAEAKQAIVSGASSIQGTLNKMLDEYGLTTSSELTSIISSIKGDDSNPTLAGVIASIKRTNDWWEELKTNANIFADGLLENGGAEIKGTSEIASAISNLLDGNRLKGSKEISDEITNFRTVFEHSYNPLDDLDVQINNILSKLDELTDKETTVVIESSGGVDRIPTGTFSPRNMSYTHYASGLHRSKGNYNAITQEDGSEILFRSADGAVLTPINTGDMVFSHEMSENLWNLAKGNYVVGTAKATRTSGNTNVSVAIGDIILPKVNNPEQFSSELLSTIKNDTKIQKAVQAITIDTIAGKPLNEVNKIN